jgi:hypothetical protein
MAFEAEREKRDVQMLKSARRNASQPRTHAHTHARTATAAAAVVFGAASALSPCARANTHKHTDTQQWRSGKSKKNKKWRDVGRGSACRCRVFGHLLHLLSLPLPLCSAAPPAPPLPWHKEESRSRLERHGASGARLYGPGRLY